MAENVTYIISLRDKFSKRLESIRRNTNRLDGSVGKLSSSIVRLGSVFGALQLGKQIFKVGVEFEQTEVAFQSMLGSIEKGTKLFDELIQFSKDTPFLSKEVTTLSKRLMAQGVAAEDLLGTMTLLGNMSSALGKDKLPALTLAFGQVKAATFLRGQELRQFEEAGVNLKKLLAEELGVEIKDVTELVSKQAVSFEVVEKALNNLAGTTGKWGNMMENLMETTGGKFMVLMSNLEIKAREISKDSFPLLNKGLDFLNNNFDSITSVLMRAIKVFAIYKTTLIGVNIATRIFVKSQTLAKIATIAFSRGLRSTTFLMKGFKASLVSTGIGALAVGIGFLVERLISWRIETKSQTDEQTSLNEALAETNRLIGQKEYDDFIQSLGAVQERFENINGIIRRTFSFKNIDIVKNFGEALTGFSEKQLNDLEVFFGESILSLKRGMESASDIIKVTSKQDIAIFRRNLNLVRQELEKIKSLRDKEGIASGGMLERAGITSLKASAPKVFNINIEKLVENINNNVTNLKEGMTESKKIVTEALLDALNQTQITALQ